MINKTAKGLCVDAVVFDAYGTLFDVQSVAVTAERLFPERGAALAQLWRTKQLQYTWLQTLMQSPTQRRDDFASITAQSLDFAAEALHISLAGGSRHRLLDAYLDLAPFPDAEIALAHLAPLPRLILSNGTSEMLEPLAANAYKPHPRAYQLAVDHLKIIPVRVGFVSSNSWDAIGAKAFGFTVFWVNRDRAPLDRHGPRPDHVLSSLAELPGLVET